MNYVIDAKAKEPAYYQIYEMVKKDILEGVYPLGTKLPSKRILSSETGVSTITVEHALGLLAEEGYIESRERSGYFIIYRKSDFGAENEMQGQIKNAPKASQIAHHRQEDVSLDLISKTMRKVLLDYGERILEKSPNYGAIELRDEIRMYLARSRGIHVDLDQVIIGSGAEYLYGLIAGMFEEKKRFAIEDPSYEKIALVYKGSGKKVLPLAIGSRGIPTELLVGLKADILHVTPFHSFPSGATADVSKRNEYLEWARKNDAYVIEDNYDSELTVSRKAEEPLFSMDKERVIYVNTFSKTIASSARVGYMILPKGLLPKYEERFGRYSCTVPVLEQFLIAELIRSGNYERHINRIKRARRREAQGK